MFDHVQKVNRKVNYVYGGGSVGLMGMISHRVFNGGCHVLGIIPKALVPLKREQKRRDTEEDDRNGDENEVDIMRSLVPLLSENDELKTCLPIETFLDYGNTKGESRKKILTYEF
ncbi:hypothetical protein LXL04_037208 [Taraxacum kok-saghyz]